jgi:tRNA G18 (ribose-2'-O)-methylase SpoU
MLVEYASTKGEGGMTTRRAGRCSRGYSGIAIYHPKSEVNVGTLWRTAFLYDVAFIATIGHRYHKQASDTPGTANHVPLFEYESFDEFYSNLPYDCPLVGVELDEAAVPLTDFVHPQRCVYLLGAEDHGLPGQILDRCHRKVMIPTVRDFSMNVSVAGSLVLFDRYAKRDRLSIARSA